MNLLLLLLLWYMVVLHLGFLVIEMVLWTKPMGRKIFRMKPEYAQQTRVLAMNQGFYNGIIAVGLALAILYPSSFFQSFFLASMGLAGVVGGLTVDKSVFIIQGVPAFVTLTLHLYMH